MLKIEALKRAIESDWLMLLEEVGLWIPAEVVNKEIDDKPENERAWTGSCNMTLQMNQRNISIELDEQPEEKVAGKVPLKEYEFDTKKLANAQSHLHESTPDWCARLELPLSPSTLARPLSAASLPPSMISPNSTFEPPCGSPARKVCPEGAKQVLWLTLRL
ncbi:hypothetical protein Taro_038125 [Colocasia esculenta]|uniref:Uncharacterized protein n=1 Tax=Colocasia esculenta TaxID=4460 RepID=A0A843W5U8_COLES|nr:hypothetical protein [Colocasia esculenta]